MVALQFRTEQLKLQPLVLVLIREIYDGIPICMGIHLLDKDGRKEGEALTISLMAA